MRDTVLGVGPAVTCHFLLELDLLSPWAFADKVRVEAHQGRIPVMPKAFLEEIIDGNDTDCNPLLVQYIIAVITVYGSATYYDSVWNICNVRTGPIEKAWTLLLVNHASDKLHPCTAVVFTEENAKGLTLN
jgi:hypothetical protein